MPTSAETILQLFMATILKGALWMKSLQNDRLIVFVYVYEKDEVKNVHPAKNKSNTYNDLYWISANMWFDIENIGSTENNPF